MKCIENALLNQNAQEMADFISLLKREKVLSYLEIGSKFGGSLWPIANALPRGSRVVSVDLPHGPTKPTQPALEECVFQLHNRGYDARLFIGDCTDPGIIKKVGALGPYDAFLIDPNRAEPFVRSDWKNYGPMARIVAFHDIGFNRVLAPGKNPIDVPKVWAELKAEHRHVEIRHEERDN